MPDPTVLSSSVPYGKALPRFGPGGSGSGGSASSASSNYSGAGSPEGVVAASVGAIYTNTSTGGLWNKVTGNGTNTGWNELIT